MNTPTCWGFFNLITHGLNRSWFSGREAHAMIHARANLSKTVIKNCSKPVLHLTGDAKSLILDIWCYFQESFL